MTLFVVGELAAGEEGPPLRRLLDETPDLHDVNSHTWSHSRLICKNPWSLPVPTPEFIFDETTRGVAAIRDRLDRPCPGFRPDPGRLRLSRLPGEPERAARRGVRVELGLPQVGVRGTRCPATCMDRSATPTTATTTCWSCRATAGRTRWSRTTGAGCSTRCAGRRRSPIRSAWWRRRRRSSPCTGARSMLPRRPACRSAASCSTPWTMIRRQDPDGDCIDLLLRLARERGHEVTTLDAAAAAAGATATAVAGSADSAAAHARLRCRPTLRLSPEEPSMSARPNSSNSPNSPNVIVFFTDQQRWDTTGHPRQPQRPHAQLRPVRRARPRTSPTPSPVSRCAGRPGPACRPAVRHRTGVFRNSITWTRAADAAGSLPRRRV